MGSGSPNSEKERDVEEMSEKTLPVKVKALPPVLLGVFLLGGVSSASAQNLTPVRQVCGSSVFCMEQRLPEEAPTPRLFPLIGAGILGAGAGTALLAAVAKPLGDTLEEDPVGYEEEEHAGVAVLFLLPWIGGVTGVLAAAPDPPLDDIDSMILIGGSSFLLSLIGPGVAWALGVRSDAGLLATFAIGAGAGAALGYMAAHGVADEHTARSGLINLNDGRWSAALPSVQMIPLSVPGPEIMRGVVLFKSRF